MSNLWEYMGFEKPVSPTYSLIVITSEYLVVESGEKIPKEYRRSWKERLLTLPWRPWRSTRIVMVPEMIPDPHVYRLNDVVLMHPRTKGAIWNDNRTTTG